MKRLITLPLALLIAWFAGCTSDLTSPVGLGPSASTAEATIDAFATASVVTGFLHSCALTADGTAYCWGDNGYGQLGVERRQCAPISNPGIYCELIPVRVRGGLTFTSLNAGAYHTCGITPTGELYCWGLNGNGQLGVPTGETCISGIHPCSSTPLQVTGGIRSVEGGFTHTCALTTTGQPYCWGGNLFGQLGVNDTNNRASPTAVHGQHTFASIEAGGYQTCALTAMGVAYCWGVNDKGQLGAPSTQTCYYVGVPYACQMAPIPVSGGLRFASLSLGHQHACGIVAPAPSTPSAARQTAAAGPVFTFASHTPAAWGASPDNGAVPAAPTGLSATAVSSSQINLAWTDNSGNEDGFEVWRTTGNGNFTVIVRTGPNVTSHSDTGLQPSTTYYYGVVAFNAAGNSPPSNRSFATTHAGPPPPPPPPPPPAAPSALQANAASPTQVNLSWTDNSGNEDGFRVERHAGDGNFSVIATLGPNVTSFSNGSLSEGTTFTYRVQAFNGGGPSAWSNERSATTWLNTPTNLAAQGVSSSQINLSWTDNSQRETAYEIQRRTGGGSFAPIATVGANVTSYSDGGLQTSTTYTYRVRATSPAASSNWSNEASGTTGAAPPPPPPPTPPAAPSGLSATAVSSSQINLQWTDNSTNEDGFQVWRVHNEVQRMVAQLGPNVTSYSDTGLQPSNTYYYGVVAINGAGASAPSNPASATTHPAAPSPPPPPAAPSALQANAASPTQVNLTWTDNSGNEDGFRIERHAGDGNFSVIATLGPNVTSFSNGSLSEGTAYTYRVQAFNVGGASSWSNAASATTWLNTPTSLAAQGASSSQMNLSWNDNSQRETGYEVQRSTNNSPFATIATLGANSTSYSDTGLLESNTYSYRVRATRVGASSAWSNQATAPATPAGVTAYGLSPTQIQLTWFDTSNNEDGFRIERHAGDGNFTLIATVGPNVTQYINSSLSEGTAYTYRVQAFNASDASFWSRTASTWTWLNTPTNLAAQAVSSSQINISWTDNSQRETGYEVHRKQGGSAFFPIATLGGNTTSYSDTGLQPGTNYTYRVRAIIVGIGSASAFSNEASATTNPVNPPPGGPAAPTNLTASLVETNEIQLDWHPSPDADGYRIERHAGDGAFVQIFELGVHWYRDRNLQLGTTYTYRVRAYTLAGGLSAYSNEASASTPAPPSAGNVYCWGNNVRGQLGVNVIQDFFTTPTRVWGGHDFSLVTTGTDHTCGLLADGRAYCWGWNGDGQFGNGNFGVDAGSRAPIPTTPGLTWRQLSAGQHHSCGISTGGLTYCWGQNPRGQIGDGTRNILRPSPTEVLPPSP